MPSTATENPERDPPCKPSTAMPLSTPWVTAITSVMTATSSGRFVRHPEDRCARQQVHVLRPAAEQAGVPAAR